MSMGAAGLARGRLSVRAAALDRGFESEQDPTPPGASFVRASTGRARRHASRESRNTARGFVGAATIAGHTESFLDVSRSHTARSPPIAAHLAKPGARLVKHAAPVSGSCRGQVGPGFACVVRRRRYGWLVKGMVAACSGPAMRHPELARRTPAKAWGSRPSFAPQALRQASPEASARHRRARRSGAGIVGPRERRRGGSAGAKPPGSD